MIHLESFSDESLKNTIKYQKTPLLIAFWAPWSNACKTLEPLLLELAKDYGRRLQVGILNVDENAHSPVEFGVINIPHLILFDSGTSACLAGPQPKARILEFIEKNLYSR